MRLPAKIQPSGQKKNPRVKVSLPSTKTASRPEQLDRLAVDLAREWNEDDRTSTL